MPQKGLRQIASRVPVMSYVDYRDYLAELYRRAKECTSPYSYEAFAADLGFSAINTLRLVIVRQRLLGDGSAQTVAKSLGLHRAERKYFLAMVRHINARSPKIKAQYFQKMLDAKSESILSHKDKDQLAFLSEWYHWLVLETLRLDQGKADPAWIAAHLYPDVSVEKIRRSLALLESLGLVRLDADGAHLNQESPMIVASDQTAGHLAMTKHHQSMLAVAQEALGSVPADQREFNALTVTLSIESFELLRERLKQVCAEILQMESQQQPRQCVAHVNVNLFALTKWDEEGES